MTVRTDTPLRVLHLGSPTGLYGAERWILALVRHLPAAQVHSIVSVLKDAPHYPADLCREAAKFGVETHIFEAHGRLSFPAVKQLRRYIRAQRIDIIHTHGYKTDLLGRLAVIGTDCRILTTPHGWSVNAGTALRIYEALDRMSFPFMDAVVPLSEDLYRELVRIPGVRRRLHLIRNGVDLSEVRLAPDSCAALADSKARGDFLIGYIGQLITRKGIHSLIRAFAQLANKRARLCLIGEGPQRDELEALAAALGVAGRVDFLGYRPDRLSFLKQFDVFVLPSALEGIPRCVLESMAAGIAVIATDIPGCRDVVHHESTGLLVPLGDDAALAAALTRMSDDETQRRALGTAGQMLVENEFSAQSMANRYAELYRRIVPVKSVDVPVAQVVE